MSIFDQALTRTDGKTLILTNGSKWAGDTPDDIQVLLEVLAKNVLDPSFEQYHCYEPVPFDPLLKERGEESARKYLPWVGAATFSGNFLTVSHVFHIITQDQQVIETLAKPLEEIWRNLNTNATPTSCTRIGTTLKLLTANVWCRPRKRKTSDPAISQDCVTHAILRR